MNRLLVYPLRYVSLLVLLCFVGFPAAWPSRADPDAVVLDSPPYEKDFGFLTGDVEAEMQTTTKYKVLMEALGNYPAHRYPKQVFVIRWYWEGSDPAYGGLVSLTYDRQKETLTFFDEGPVRGYSTIHHCITDAKLKTLTHKSYHVDYDQLRDLSCSIETP